MTLSLLRINWLLTTGSLTFDEFAHVVVLFIVSL